MPKFKVPEVTVERLSIYLRALRKLDDERILSSQELAELVGTTAVQIRKDLDHFGEFGIPGQGYKVRKLKEEIARILGLDRTWRLALVGVGKLGAALLAYPGFKRKEFEIKAAFDSDPAKIGTKIEGFLIRDVKEIPKVLPKLQIKIGVITTPAEAAQDVANLLIKGGVEGILNFAPTRIIVPNEVRLKNVDLSIELETLAYFLSRSKSYRRLVG